MHKIIDYGLSPRKNKRYRIYMDDGTYYDFGLEGGKTYLDHKDKRKRENYRKRHYAQEKNLVDNLTPSPSLFSYYILWGNSSDITENIRELNKMFKK